MFNRAALRGAVHRLGGAMTDDKHNQGEADRALVRSMQARLAQFSGAGARLVDQFMARIERHEYEHGPISLDNPSSLPTDVAVALIARVVIQRAEDARRRIAELEDDEQPAYVEAGR